MNTYHYLILLFLTFTFRQEPNLVQSGLDGHREKFNNHRCLFSVSTISSFIMFMSVLCSELKGMYFSPVD